MSLCRYPLCRFFLLLGLLSLRSVNAEPFPIEAMVNGDYWHTPAFRDNFRPSTTSSLISHRYWPEATELLGHKPHVITAKFVGGNIRSINLLFLDSGTHFGYVPIARAKANEMANQAAFQKYFGDVKFAVIDGLQKLAKPGAKTGELGKEKMLKQNVSFFATGNLVARFHVIEEQLIKVTFFREQEDAEHWIAPDLLKQNPRDRVAAAKKNVKKLPNGDVLVTNIPLLPQGDRAYCGLSALAMTMQYLGLEIDTEDYAAASGVRYGSTRGSRIREVYSEAAEEAGFRMSRATRFDAMKTKSLIDSGVPVLVWRRWTQERDFLHTAFARRFAKDPTLQLPRADAADREMWPGKDDYSHATVITGYNQERGELIFTESWSERERNRRMRAEEMIGTAYYTFFLRL